jgi:hypothetical protein
MVGRSTQGVHLMGVGPGESVASISCFDVGQVSGKTEQRITKKAAAESKGNGKPPAKGVEKAPASKAAKPVAKSGGKAPSKGTKPVEKSPPKGRRRP